MIFDHRTGALYTNEGDFIKTVYCPLAISPEQLRPLESSDKNCSICNSNVISIDNCNDEDVLELVTKDDSACVFASAASRNIVFLHPPGLRLANDRNLLVIRTHRSLESMADIQSKGYDLIFRNTSQVLEKGEEKFIVYQHLSTGKLWWSWDYRSDKPTFENDTWNMKDWKLIRDWFFARSDAPFPLAAYAIPNGLTPNTKVFLEDLIEDSFQETWNQGNAQRRISSEATWNGVDLIIDDAPPSMVFG